MRFIQAGTKLNNYRIQHLHILFSSVRLCIKCEHSESHLRTKYSVGQKPIPGQVWWQNEVMVVGVFYKLWKMKRHSPSQYEWLHYILRVRDSIQCILALAIGIGLWKVIIAIWRWYGASDSIGLRFKASHWVLYVCNQVNTTSSTKHTGLGLHCIATCRLKLQTLKHALALSSQLLIYCTAFEGNIEGVAG